MIEVCKYNPEWKNHFEILRNRLLSHIASISTQIEHVGSTSVEGLWAKPVIDIDIVIESKNQLDDIIVALSQLGYQHIGDQGIQDREAFEYGSSEIKHNLYVCTRGSTSLKNHLLLRDHLRRTPEDQRKYSVLKRKLAEQHPEDIHSYVDGKTDFIVSILNQYDLPQSDLDSIKKANSKVQ